MQWNILWLENIMVIKFIFIILVNLMVYLFKTIKPFYVKDGVIV